MGHTKTEAADGRKFDSSRDRGTPFEFKVGDGKVIAGWDQGLTSVCLGERGVLHVPSYKGYGSNGAGQDIPPDATLDFDVELLAINKFDAPQYHRPTPPPAPKVHSGASCEFLGVAAFAVVVSALTTLA